MRFDKEGIISTFEACEEETMVAPGGLYAPPSPPLDEGDDGVVLVVLVGQGEWDLAVGS